MLNIAAARRPHVRFKQVAVEDRGETIKKGRVVTRDVNMAYIMQPGSKDEVERPAEEWIQQIRRNMLEESPNAYPAEWVEIFERNYGLFKQGTEIPIEGTHLKNWPLLTPAQAENLTAMNIFTVEEVANMNEEALQAYGIGGRDLRDKAKAYLQSADDLGKSAQEIAALKADNETLSRTIEALTQRLTALEEKKGPGRPRKEE